MQAEELLTVTPEALVASILKRRKAAASSLPTTLEQRIEENNRAYQLANGARATLKQLEADEQPDANHLDALEKARNVYDEHEAFRRRTDSRLKKAKHAMKAPMIMPSRSPMSVITYPANAAVVNAPKPCMLVTTPTAASSPARASLT